MNPHERLQDAVPASKLFHDWLDGSLKASFLKPEHGDATVELGHAISAENPAGAPAPLFQTEWVAQWAPGFEEDLPTDEDREAFGGNLAGLTAGTTGLVVTGQQPGFLGGPLLTLYKIATAVELARQRTTSGKPTVPVFWSGDDDDDLAEALSPVGWDREHGVLVRASGHLTSGVRPPIIGRLARQAWTSEAGSWLEKWSGGGTLSKDLAELWRQAYDGGLSWSRLSRQVVLRLFSGTGLLVISGDDPDLHAAARPFYERIGKNSDALHATAANRGMELKASGWHAQITDRSLARPWFRVEGDHRVPQPVTTMPADMAELRPGVMLRSPVQDYLLRPAAVVVGPGELAYLRQLDGIYEELAITRPPLVPRLFAWLTPEGFPVANLARFKLSGAGDPGLAEKLADRAASEAGQVLAEILTSELNLSAERAADLAAGRTRRWRKGVAAMLADEIQRKHEREIPSRPGWVFPDRQRQERKLALGCAVAFWGDEMVGAVLKAAREHLELGTGGDWREFILEVPEP